MTDALVIGAGPAGLMAAEMLAASGRRVVIAEAKPTPARKFLMAGKSGLNLTKDEPFGPFIDRYDAPGLRPMLEAFGADAVMRWARELGIELFTGSTGRVFPVGMKASPLLRVWIARLSANGAELRTRWRWAGFDGDGFAFETPAGPQVLHPRATVLALGGASWPRLGSDAAWVPWLEARGVGISPFRPANMGFRIRWSEHMRRHLGRPVKGVALMAGDRAERGEFVLSERGVEGGGVYAVSRPVREGAEFRLDLAPDRSVEEIAAQLSGGPGKATVTTWLRKALRFDPVRIALLQEWGRPLPGGAELARLVKTLPVRHDGPRPVEEAISTAGGVRWDAVTDELELKALPGVFVSGEMLDWEAPTGGYLLTACLATGRHAGVAAARRCCPAAG